MSKPKLTPDISALLKRLIREYPACFKPESQEPLPLAHGVHWQILDATYPDVAPLVVRRALTIYTARPAYQAALKLGAARVNLKGEPSGIVEAQRPPQASEPNPPAKPKTQKTKQKETAR
jgi:sRNA-binding protein